MTSLAMISPATEGTKAVLPGIERFELLWVFWGLTEAGVIGASSEYTTFSFWMPLFFNSRLITLASGHIVVLYISVT